MGANASKSVDSATTGDKQEQAFYSERPVRFSPSLIQHLSDLPSPGGDNAPSSGRQSTLDEHVRQRIQSELARLKAQEAEIQDKIARALEKENLDKETAADKGVKSSQVLQQALEEISRKVQQHKEKRDIQRNFPEVAKARNDLVACYKQNKDRPLDCWYEAAEFRAAVRKAETVSWQVSEPQQIADALRHAQSFVEKEAAAVQ